MSTLRRRELLKLLAAGFSTTSLSGWFPVLARESVNRLERPRACILLWMPGGPSQLDTFDPKPEHENGGEFEAIETSVPGIRICEHLPQLARRMEHLAVIRSMRTKEGDHGRATYHLRTGYLPEGTLHHPTLGAFVGNEHPENVADLPNYVSILSNPFINPAAFGPGFLGPRHAPLLVGSDGQPNRSEELEYGAPLEVRNIQRPEGVGLTRAQAREELLEFVESRFSRERPGLPTESHQSAYEQALRMMQSPAMKAFRLEEEPEEIRAAYGKNRFGQGCLLARRLIEQGVPFVEVALGGADGNDLIAWDTHADNFTTVRSLCEVLDPAWSMLLSDLEERGLLETTTIVWMGEFGRTPRINGNTGRDHYPNAWSTVLAGGGVKGGQVYGATDGAGMDITEHPVVVNEFLATLLAALGIDHTNQNMSDIGRPIRLVEPEAEPIDALFRGHSNAEQDL
jgi:hypothetical protein